MKISWKNLSYTVNAQYSKTERERLGTDERTFQKKVLNDESGYAEPGEALFIMGASGAGKTTLLNALWDRLDTRNGAQVSGEVVVNNSMKVNQGNFGNYGAYVMQDDILFDTMTCQECLEFSAKLRLGISNDEVELLVDSLINKLGLVECKDTLVGNNQIKGLSGGEKKRTSIGVELITNPSIIFWDEPTSGLDSFNAQKIVKILVDQAKSGKTVIATIHQPNSSTFKIFDRLLLMCEGNTIYQGPASDSVEYFEKLGYKCPTYTNPSDFFLKEFSVPREITDEYYQMVEKLSIEYDKTEDMDKIEGKLISNNTSEQKYNDVNEEMFEDDYR